MQQRFIIAYVGRSGSSHLEGLLDAHPDCQCLGEILWPDGLAGHSVVKVIEAKVHVANERVSGFKFPHLHMFEHPELRDWLGSYEYKVCYLTRENRLDQYISMKLAMENNSWRSDAGAYRRHSFIADHGHLEEFFVKFEDHDSRTRQYIEGLPTHAMTYEQLVRPDGYVPFLDFLGLTRRKLVSRYERQRRGGGQRDGIENYDEMAERFANTPFSCHFTE